jgi:Rad3-related DNA helicase
MADTDSVQNITTKLETGVKEVYESDRYAQYLQTMSRFHRYSTRNTLLIHLQRPGATHVCGKDAWNLKFNRQVCNKKSQTYLSSIGNRAEKQRLEKLFMCASIDGLDEVDGLTPEIRKAVSAKGRCPDACPHRQLCVYRTQQERKASQEADIYICSHHHLLTDATRRSNGLPPLLPNYQMLIIADAHILPAAARSVYGIDLSSESAPNLHKTIGEMVFRRAGLQDPTQQSAKKLSAESARLFKGFMITAEIDTDSERHLPIA